MVSQLADLVPAGPADEPILADLLQPYAREFSEFHPIALSADGRFVYRDLPKYWLDPGKHPFLIKIEAHTAGFVLVQQTHSIPGGHLVWEIAEFFVLPKYRRRGIGTQVAHRVWKRFPGTWQVRVLEANDAAVHFWDQSILQFTGNHPQSSALDRDGERWQVFSFES
jgi:predicted acetyltransferase